MTIDNFIKNYYKVQISFLERLPKDTLLCYGMKGRNVVFLDINYQLSPEANKALVIPKEKADSIVSILKKENPYADFKVATISKVIELYNKILNNDEIRVY